MSLIERSGNELEILERRIRKLEVECGVCPEQGLDAHLTEDPQGSEGNAGTGDDSDCGDCQGCDTPMGGGASEDGV